MQCGVIVVLEEGDYVIWENFVKVVKSCDIFCDVLIVMNCVEMLKFDGVFYVFLKIDGVKDSWFIVFDIVDKVLVGFVFGIVFGLGGSVFICVCFLCDFVQMEVVVDRFVKYIVSF